MNSVIDINQRYKSSTRIDSEAINAFDFIDDFVVHGTAYGVLDTLGKDISLSNQRTFTITGPYGSGKSTLALFLSLLLSEDKKTSRAAAKKLEDSGVDAKNLLVNYGYSKGWKTIKHVCGVEHPLKSLAQSLITELGIQGLKVDDQETDAELLTLIKDVLNHSSIESDGVFVLVDEMGKALDYLSRNNHDLHIFQSLADLVQQSKKKVVFIGFLHQSFVDYAKNKELSAQKEWAKVQGRYKDFSFSPSVDESLVLVADSIAKSQDLEAALFSQFRPAIEAVADHFKISKQSIDALQKCLPLSPVVSMLLGPISKRRFSQNERSLFGFLASHEKYGFKEFCQEHYQENTVSELYSASELWSYLLHNLDHTISSSTDSKAWLEAKDAVDRAEQKGGKLHSDITKLVALLTMFGFQHHLHAKPQFVLDYFESRGISSTDTQQALEALKEWSILIYRARHDAFFVFQGSDIDVQALTEEKVELLKSGLDWTSVCQTSRRILASRHYHKDGVMRWADINFVGQKNKQLEDLVQSASRVKTGEAFLHFVVVTDSNLKNELLENFGDTRSIAIAESSDLIRLEELSVQLLALQKLKDEIPNLQHDLIAQKELKGRTEETVSLLEQEIDKYLENTDWFCSGTKHKKGSLSVLASELADQAYHKTPAIINELINRSKPSGNANSATKKLMERMLNKADEEDLGFGDSEFPPEKGIYLSCVKSNFLHSKTDEGYRFTVEFGEQDEQNPRVAALMQDTLEFIHSRASIEKLSIQELYDFWMLPPYGLTIGVCRIFALALLKAMEGQLAFYDLDSTNTYIYIPELDQELVDKIFKHPKEAAIRYYAATEIQGQLIHTLAAATVGLKNEQSNEIILSIAKHIAQLVHTLPNWVKKTSGNIFGKTIGTFELSSQTKQFRDSVLRASDPYDLVLSVLPKVFKVSAKDQEASDRLASQISRAIEELKSQHQELTNSFAMLIKNNLSAEFDEQLITRCESVLQSAQRPTVREFAHRLLQVKENNQGIEHVISLAAGVVDRNWTDKHLRSAYDDIQNLCLQFRRAESFAKATEKTASSTDSVPIAFMTMNENGEYKEHSEHVSLKLSNDKDVKVANQTAIAAASKLNKEQKLALLSSLANEFFNDTKLATEK